MATAIALDFIKNAFSLIGYPDNLLQADYEFADFYISPVELRTIELGVFGQEPLNYRSACFGVHIAHQNKRDFPLNSFRAFGAPLLFFVRNGKTQVWQNTGQAFILKDELKTTKLPDLIKHHEDIWNPTEMIRIKSGFKRPGPRQMDFIDIGLLPALEHEASTKIDGSIREILYNTEQEFRRYRIEFNAATVFQVFFRLLAAKLIKDCNVPGAANIDFSNPTKTLSYISDHYGNGEKPQVKPLPEVILDLLAVQTAKMFCLKNISVDTLTFVYENTFVSEKNRRELGIHSTPAYVADYVLRQLPIEELPQSRWNFLDPTCGHAIFLIAAMRRMRDLLPANWDGEARHRFFLERLHGIEIDAFSVEVARMCLMLADFPETNGWDLHHGDVFTGNILESASAKASIVIGNPPFEKFSDYGPEIPKPVKLLKRILPTLTDGSLIGMVLPRSFLDGSDYRSLRSDFLRNFHILSLTTLPDKIFLHSEAETTVIIARKQESKKNGATVYREVKEHHRERFQAEYGVTWEETIRQSYFTESQQERLILPMLNDLWERLKSLPRLEEFADVKIGVQYEPSETKGRIKDIIQDRPFPGSKPGIYNITPGFMSYVAADTTYMETDATLRRKRARGAWELDWSRSKIVVPASRTSRGPWRYSAAIDNEKRLVSRRFYAIWPKGDLIGIEPLAALLNSPIAQAFVYAHSFQHDIPARVYNSIPIPRNIQQAELLISSLVRNYIELQSSGPEKAKKILLRIDAEILKLYCLPPAMERRLLDIFWGESRRKVPFDFNGYIPPENASWIPLHIYLSEEYGAMAPKSIMDGVPTQPDHEMLQYIDSVWRNIP